MPSSKRCALWRVASLNVCPCVRPYVFVFPRAFAPCPCCCVVVMCTLCVAYAQAGLPAAQVLVKPSVFVIESPWNTTCKETKDARNGGCGARNIEIRVPCDTSEGGGWECTNFTERWPSWKERAWVCVCVSRLKSVYKIPPAHSCILDPAAINTNLAGGTNPEWESG